MKVRTQGDSHTKRAGVLVGNVEKNSQKAPRKILFSGRGTNLITAHFRNFNSD